MVNCSRCGGTGKIFKQLGNWQSEMVKCPDCNGTGISPQNQCKDCGGTGTVWDSWEGMPKECHTCKGTGRKW